MLTNVLLFLMLLPSWIPAAFLPVDGSTSTSARRIEITAKRFSFQPSTITLKKGEPVVLVLKSLDVPHGIRVRELNIDVKASKGSTGEVRFTPQAAGEFVGQCSVFCGTGHGSMKLTFEVVQ